MNKNKYPWGKDIVSVSKTGTGQETPAWQTAYNNYNNKASEYRKKADDMQFSYNQNNDMLYNQYKDHYTRQAQLGMEDAIGRASALTGGYGNSYAMSAGMQAYDARMDELNNIIPDLYQIAYNKFNDDRNALYGKADYYGGLAQQEFDNYIARTEAEAALEEAKKAALEEAKKKSEPEITDDMRAVLSGLTTNKAISDQLNRWLAAGIITDEQGITLQGQYGKDEHNWKTNAEGKYVDAEGNEISENDIASKGVLDYIGMMGNPDGWGASYDGGFNWWGGMDRDAKLIMPTGKEITVNDLLAKLKEQGMNYWQARSVIMNLQKKLGIHN